MGCGISKGDLKAVEEVTGMSEGDVKEAYKGFKDENKADKINLDKFTKLVSSMNTNKGTSQIFILRRIVKSIGYNIGRYLLIKTFNVQEMQQNIRNIFFGHLIQIMTKK